MSQTLPYKFQVETLGSDVRDYECFAAAGPLPNVRPTLVRVALPAYNEEQSIGSLVLRLAQVLGETPWHYDILIVDDGSHDTTVSVIEELQSSYPIRLVRHNVNRGLGAAITTCLNEAIQGLYDDDIVITMDADNTHPPQLISRMVPMIREGHDIVVASRFQPGAQVIGLAWHRVLLSIGASYMMRFLFGIKGCRDYTCGYRAYRVGTLREAHSKLRGQWVRESGFASMAELLLNLAESKVVVGEVPLLLRYDFKRGNSKMRIGRTIYRTLRMVIRRRLGM